MLQEFFKNSRYSKTCEDILNGIINNIERYVKTFKDDLKEGYSPCSMTFKDSLKDILNIG